MPIEPSDVRTWQVITPRTGGVALLIWLGDAAGGRLERLTADSIGNTLSLEEPDGTVVLSVIVHAAIRGGRFAVTFTDPEAARRTAGRLGGAR